MRPTSTGYLLLGLCVLLYLASLTSSASLLIFLIGILGGCLVINLFQARLSLKGLRLELPEREAVVEGASPRRAWFVENAGRTGAGMVEVWQGTRPVGRLLSLAGGGREAVVLRDGGWRRGRHRFDALRFRTAFPFGLVRCQRQADGAGEVLVFPAVYEAPCPPVAGFRPMVGGKHRGSHRLRSGTDFAGIRPFQDGDSFHQIHWKSSAKGQGLMVKQFEEELSGCVAFVLDRGLPGEGGRETYDALVRAAGSLMFACLDRGHHVEWTDVLTLHRRQVPPFADGEELLTDLSDLEWDDRGWEPERLLEAADGLSASASLCLVLSRWDETLDGIVSVLRARRPSVSVYLPAASESGGTRPAGVGGGVYHERRVEPWV